MGPRARRGRRRRARAGAAVLTPCEDRERRGSARRGLTRRDETKRASRRRALATLLTGQRTRRAAGPQRSGRPRRRARVRVLAPLERLPAGDRPGAPRRRRAPHPRSKPRAAPTLRKPPTSPATRALAPPATPARGWAARSRKPHSGRYPPTSPPPCAVLERLGARAALPPRAERRPPRRRRAGAGASAGDGGGARRLRRQLQTNTRARTRRAPTTRADCDARWTRCGDVARLLRAVDPNASLAAYLSRRAFAGARQDARDGAAPRRYRRRKFLRYRKQNVFTERRNARPNAVREEDLWRPWSFARHRGGGVARGGLPPRGGRGDGPRRGGTRALRRRRSSPDGRRALADDAGPPAVTRASVAHGALVATDATPCRRTPTKAASTGPAPANCRKHEDPPRRTEARSSPRALCWTRRRMARGARGGDGRCGRSYTSRARKRRTPDPTARAFPRPPSALEPWTRRWRGGGGGGGRRPRRRPGTRRGRRACHNGGTG